MCIICLVDHLDERGLRRGLDHKVEGSILPLRIYRRRLAVGVKQLGGLLGRGTGRWLRWAVCFSGRVIVAAFFCCCCGLAGGEYGRNTFGYAHRYLQKTKQDSFWTWQKLIFHQKREGSGTSVIRKFSGCGDDRGGGGRGVREGAMRYKFLFVFCRCLFRLWSKVFL